MSGLAGSSIDNITVRHDRPSTDLTGTDPVGKLMRQFNNKFAINAGNFVIPRDVRHNTSDIPTLLNRANGPSLDKLHNILQDGAVAAGGTTIKEIAEPKNFQRIVEKAQYEKGGDAACVMDICRGALIVHTPKQLDNLSQFFRPSNNRHVVSFEDNFARPIARSGLRRIKTVLDVDGDCFEAQVWHAGMQKVFDKTHDLYVDTRKVEAQMERLISAGGLTVDNDTARALARRADKSHDKDAKRLQLHDEQAAKYGLNCLVEHQEFMLIDGKAVAHITRDFQRSSIVITADPISGLYKIDNDYLDPIHNKEYTSIRREDFVRYSIEAVRPDLRVPLYSNATPTTGPLTGRSLLDSGSNDSPKILAL